MRIFISNTAKDQAWQGPAPDFDSNAFDFDTGLIPTFRVKLEGRLLDDEEGDATELNPDSDLGLAPTPTAAQLPKRKFSHFFKSIVVELERSRELHPEGNTIEWRKQSPNTQPATGALGLNGPQEFDGFEFERKGEENINCTIKLTRDEAPDRFRLSPALADLLDTKEDTRAGIVMKLWEYVRANGLQDPEEKRNINCNAQLRQVTSSPPSFSFPSHSHNSVH
jgi:SWI/SNF-related matrix-associated actin-dependent regulator of chromatin subfamily D